jgi:ferredoxin
MLQPGEVSGLISTEQLNTLVPDLIERQVHVCGPGGFVATARELIEPVAERFVAEGFTPPPVAAPTEPAEATTVQVHLQRSGRTLAVRTDQTLLQALEAQGLNPPSGCRMGICHTCSCPRVEGRTQDSLTGEHTQEATQPVRLCVSRACTDLTLDL